MSTKGFAAGAAALADGTLAAIETTPVVVFMACVTVVTIIALFRAKQDDVPKIFVAWSAAFGLRRNDESGVRDDKTDRNGESKEPT